jgi:hypothetical protein
MKSKLLQKKSYGVNQSREVVDGQQENIEDSSSSWRGHETPPNPVNPAFGAEARDLTSSMSEKLPILAAAWLSQDRKSFINRIPLLL